MIFAYQRVPGIGATTVAVPPLEIHAMLVAELA